MPELRQLRYLIAVAEERSFTRAAARLHIAQQALSQQVQKLERELEVPLLRRTSRGVEATTAGDAFLSEARQVLIAVRRAVDRTRAVNQGRTGTLRLAYTLATSYETLPTVAHGVQDRLPDLTVLPQEVFAGDLEGALRAGRFDLGVGPRAPLGAGMHHRAVRREELVVALALDHPLAGRSRIRLDELRDELFELWPEDMSPGEYRAVRAACHEAGFEPRIDPVGAGAISWVCVAQGRGVSLVAASTSAFPPPGIALVPLVDPPHLTIDLVWHEEVTNPALDWFLATAVTIAQERGWA